jgi:hypothetical protein
MKYATEREYADSRESRARDHQKAWRRPLKGGWPLFEITGIGRKNFEHGSLVPMV